LAEACLWWVTALCLAMASMSVALAALCPTPGGNTSGDLMITAQDGALIACHSVLLRARCSALPEGTTVESGEDAKVVYFLLKWIYCEHVAGQNANKDVGPRAVRLGRDWGLRDVECLQGRISARRAITRGFGTLGEDVLRAFDAGTLGTDLTFRAADSDEALYGGWVDLLQQRSAYFGAMLGGAWAEGRSGEITIHWPHAHLVHLLRFLHGASFVAGQDELQVAMDCAKFFGVPALFAEVNHWIPSHLSIQNASSLWNLIESEPLLKHQYGAAQDDVADADGACFDFHVAHIYELITVGRFADAGSEVEDVDAGASAGLLHELCIPLMHRLLSPGLLNVSSTLLGLVVVDYARTKTKGRPVNEYSELCEHLQPPAVLFNREFRAKLLPATDFTARSLLA